MFRFFLFMVSVMAVSISLAEDTSPCPGDTVPFQIISPEYNQELIRSAAEMDNPDLPHFIAFVKAVMEHVTARLTKEKLCITGAKSTDDMDSADWEHRSLFQFVHWEHTSPPGLSDYTVPVMTSSRPSNCEISSPWIDLIVAREPVPVPSIRAIVYWNERQLLADQAVLGGARNVPPGTAMPLKPHEFGHFLSEYMDLGIRRWLAAKPNEVRIPPPPPWLRKAMQDKKSPAEPIEARIPPDILWLLRRAMPEGKVRMDDRFAIRNAMYEVTEKSAEGYTKLVLALIDHCFVPSNNGSFYYRSILDIADPVLLEQYKIDMPIQD